MRWATRSVVRSRKLAITPGPWRSRVTVSVWRLFKLLQKFIVCNRSLMIAPSASRKVSGSVGMPSIGAFWTPRKARKGSCSFPGVAFTYAAIDVCPPRPLNIAVPDLPLLGGLVFLYLRGCHLIRVPWLTPSRYWRTSPRGTSYVPLRVGENRLSPRVGENRLPKGDKVPLGENRQKGNKVPLGGHHQDEALLRDVGFR